MDHFIGREVFVVTGAEEDDPCEIFITEGVDNLLDHLKYMSPSIDSETRVFHGILTLAEFLPSSFRGKSAFIVSISTIKTIEGHVREAGTTPDEVALEIESIISTGGAFPEGSITIDDIFILYGYQIETCLSINEDDMDEEIIGVCEEISEDTEIVGENSRKTQEDFIDGD